MNLMWVAINVILIVLIVNFRKIDGKNTNDKRELLPPIFHIDNYEKCKLEQKLFCKVTVLLNPAKNGNENSVWQLILDLKRNKTHYNHDELYHAICVHNFCPNITLNGYGNKLNESLSQCYTEKYKNLDLQANIVKFKCTNHDSTFEIRTFDIILMLVICSYLAYVIFATVYDHRIPDAERNGNANYFVNWIIPFSLISNWRKLRKPKQSVDFQNLKCIQGIRFYNTMLIILCHTFCSYIGGYISNTNYFEDIEQNAIRLFIRNLLVFLVQTFFLFSAFFMSYHIFQIMKQSTKFSARTILLAFLNRYLRITPPVLVMIALGSSVWIVNLLHGPIKDLYSDEEFYRCQKNWWTSILFISNHYDHHEMCYFITWYLSADTQLYALALIVLSLIWKKEYLMKVVIGGCIGVGILIPAIITYMYNLEYIFRLTPENSKNNNFRCFTFNAIYASTYANLATYMVGLGFGYIYYTCRNKILFKNKFSIAIWYLSFIGLPLLVIFITFYEYSRFYSALLSGILKPMFAIGIAIGVLGMSQKLGGIIRSVCEWKFAVFMGNFTYSTYIVHFGIVFYRTAVTNNPLVVSDYVLGISFIRDVIISFLCGFLMHILVEMPALHIQNIFVPHVRTQRVHQSKE